MPLPLADIDTGTGTEALTSDEREWIREVLGVTDVETDAVRRDTETRFDALTPYRRKSARYWMTAYEEQGDSTIQINSDGANISKERNRQRIALALYNIVFSKETVTPLDNIDVHKYEEKGSRVSMVSISFTDEEASESEY